MKSIKLLKTKKYHFKDKLYVHGKTYQMNDAMANELLRKEDDSGLPFFISSEDNPDEVLQEGEVKKAAKSASKKPTKGGGEDPNEGVSSEDGDAVSV